MRISTESCRVAPAPRNCSTIATHSRGLKATANSAPTIKTDPKCDPFSGTKFAAGIWAQILDCNTKSIETGPQN